MPTAVTVDRAGGLFVADRENNRVLYFERPFETDVIADRVFGQPDYDTSGPNTGGVSARSLNRPEGLAIDDAGHLYVADTRNHRVLRFDRAVASDAVADLVWGQGGRFEQNAEYGGTGVQADTLSYPFGLAVRSDGRLAVADTNNHRVLLFNTRAANPLQAIQVFGQGGDLTSHRDKSRRLLGAQPERAGGRAVLARRPLCLRHGQFPHPPLPGHPNRGGGEQGVRATGII
jgi:DNA-binding beta-propeller fold protein YncE